MRKIVQIAIAVAPDDNRTNRMALCDDGTVWATYSDTPWVRLPDIPQDQPPAKEAE